MKCHVFYGSVCICTQLETLRHSEDAAQHCNPRDVYNDMFQDDSVNALQHLQQVRHAKHKICLSHAPQTTWGSPNIADDDLKVISMAYQEALRGHMPIHCSLSPVFCDCLPSFACLSLSFG